MEGLSPGSNPKVTEFPWASDSASKARENSSSYLRGWPYGSKLKTYVQILTDCLTYNMLTNWHCQHPMIKPNFPEMKDSLNQHLWQMVYSPSFTTLSPSSIFSSSAKKVLLCAESKSVSFLHLSIPTNYKHLKQNPPKRFSKKVM